MIDGQRVADLMEKLELSQAELARRVGVAQPTIFKIIHQNKSGSVHLHRIARELGTTPAYLTRDTDDPDSHEPEARFSREEAEWIELLRGLAPDNRKAVMTLTRSLATSAASATVQASVKPFRAAPIEKAGQIEVRLGA